MIAVWLIAAFLSLFIFGSYGFMAVVLFTVIIAAELLKPGEKK